MTPLPSLHRPGISTGRWGEANSYDYYTSVTGIPVIEMTGRPPKFYPPKTGYCLHCDMGMDLACSCEKPRKPKFPPMERWLEGGFGGRTFKGYSYLEGEEPESILEDARRFIEWMPVHEKSVNKRLTLYRSQRK